MREKVVRKLRAGMMPPSGMRRPDGTVMNPWSLGWKRELDHNALPSPAARLHRLNRTEYANAIQDMLGLEIDATKFLPSDDSTRGFDNIAGALSLSPALLEATSSGGENQPLGDGRRERADAGDFRVPSDTSQDYHIEGLPFGTRGGMLVEYEFPADGDYTFKVKG